IAVLSEAMLTRRFPAPEVPFPVAAVAAAICATLTEAFAWMLKVPVPAFAVTVPETGCVTALPSTFHAVVLAVFPGCTVHVPPWFAVTVPETGCVACQNIPSGTQAVSGTFWQATQPERPGD